MTRRPRRNHTPAFKAKVALAVLKGEPPTLNAGLSWPVDYEEQAKLAYPCGLIGDQIDFPSRIVAVADVFDALTADRPYREAMSADRAFAILDEMTGPALDIECVDALKRALVAHEAAKAA